MVSLLHEALVELFRSGRMLAAELLRTSAGLELPERIVVENVEATFNQITPTEYRADLAQRIRAEDGRTRYAVVVEPQLTPDPDKRYSWPLYIAALHARLRCSWRCSWSRRIRRWRDGRRHRSISAPGPCFGRLWSGRTRYLEPLAHDTPELAVLSALAHGNDPGGLDVVLGAIEAITALDDEHAKLYHDLIVAHLSDAQRAELEAMMLGGKKYEYQSEIARRLVAQGREEGLEQGREEGLKQGRAEELRRALVELLEARGLLTSEVEARVAHASDLALLRVWHRRAATADRIEDVFG